MELNKEQLDKCLEKIENLWENKICEICNEKNWNLGDNIFVLKEYNGVVNKIKIKKKKMIQPILTVLCRNCGNMKIINAIVFGIVNDKSGEFNNKLL